MQEFELGWNDLLVFGRSLETQSVIPRWKLETLEPVKRKMTIYHGRRQEATHEKADSSFTYPSLQGAYGHARKRIPSPRLHFDSNFGVWAFIEVFLDYNLSTCKRSSGEYVKCFPGKRDLEESTRFLRTRWPGWTSPNTIMNYSVRGVRPGVGRIFPIMLIIVVWMFIPLCEWLDNGGMTI